MWSGEVMVKGREGEDNACAIIAEEAAELRC